MELQVNLNGMGRKELAAAISEITGEKSVYLRTPSCAYQIGAFTVNKAGNLVIAKGTPVNLLEPTLEKLAEKGFEILMTEALTEEPATEEPEAIPPSKEPETGEEDKLVIEIPADSMDEKAMENLSRIIDSKCSLIQKAIGAHSLSYEVTADRIRFPWFTLTGEDGEADAYMQFVSKLADMARNSKNITAKERAVENEKYTFRCFLLRLGFIGDEYKTTRRILLRNMTGNGSFRCANRKAFRPDHPLIPTPENTVEFDIEEAKRRLQDPEVQTEIREIFGGSR